MISTHGMDITPFARECGEAVARIVFEKFGNHPMLAITEQDLAHFAAACTQTALFIQSNMPGRSA